MENNQTATVQYQIATYSGKINVRCNENDDNEVIIARAKRLLQRYTPPFGSENYWIVEREYDEN